MRVLVIGNGGREHALCIFINKSPTCKKLFCIPGSDSIQEIANCFKIDPMNNADIVDFCKEYKIDFVVVGPELPLSNGIVDKLSEEKITVFGPDKASSQLESSKIFMKNICKNLNVPTAKYSFFDNEKKALDFLDTVDFPTVIKADGLAAGKGVIIAKNKNEAVETIKNIMSKRIFGTSGENIIIEEFLEGEEISFFALVDTNGFILPLTTAQDHKKIGENDTGLNTGGMGAYSPAPVVTSEIHKKIMNQVIIPTIKGLDKEGISYCGFLYAGLMIDKEQNIKILEFNCRFGDPETQPILMRLNSDLIELCYKASKRKLQQTELSWNSKVSLGVVMAAGGYPESYEKGNPIEGLPLETENIKVFHAGTMTENNIIKTNGGRVLCVTALGEDTTEAQLNAYNHVKQIKWKDCFYRKDIGYRAIKREA